MWRCSYAPEGAHLGAPRSILFGSVACAVTPQRAPTWEPPGPYSSIPDLIPPCSASGTGRGVEEFLRPRLRTGAVAPSCLPFRAEGAVAPMNRLYLRLLTYRFMYRRGTIPPTGVSTITPRLALMNHGVATVNHVTTPPTGSWAQDWSYITPEVDHSSGGGLRIIVGL